MPTVGTDPTQRQPLPPLFPDAGAEPERGRAAGAALVALAELAGLLVGLALAFVGSGFFKPHGIAGATKGGGARVVGWILLILSPFTAAAGPAYGYWQLRRSRAWLVPAAVLVVAVVPAVVGLARGA